MAKTKIEWTDFSINPVKGLCPMSCDYCYARRMYKRFKWNPEIWFEYACMPRELKKLKKPRKIFIGSTIELFGDWVKEAWLKTIFADVKEYPQHTFIFLTKQPQNLIKWSPFPDNCWVGVSATNDVIANTAMYYLGMLNAKIKFLSLEPLLSWDIENQELRNINWLIIGQQTPASTKTEPKIEWIKEIVEAANKARIPIFLKDNLKPLLCSTINGQDFIESHNLWAFKYFKLRQEFPTQERT